MFLINVLLNPEVLGFSLFLDLLVIRGQSATQGSMVCDPPRGPGVQDYKRVLTP